MINFEYFLPKSFLSKESLSKKVDEIGFLWGSKDKVAINEMASIIKKFIIKKESNYLRFGMYWWAVKDILKRLEMFDTEMPESDEPVKSIYSGSNDMETLVLAYEFKDMYDKSYYQGTKEFAVNDNSDTYVLSDNDIIGKF